jgi:hypothetical protein
VLVTGDKELQELVQVGRTKVLFPRAFWDELTGRFGGGASDD